MCFSITRTFPSDPVIFLRSSLAIVKKKKSLCQFLSVQFIAQLHACGFNSITACCRSCRPHSTFFSFFFFGTFSTGFTLKWMRQSAGLSVARVPAWASKSLVMLRATCNLTRQSREIWQLKNGHQKGLNRTIVARQLLGDWSIMHTKQVDDKSNEKSCFSQLHSALPSLKQKSFVGSAFDYCP